MTDLLIGIDVGTSGARAMLVTEDGTVLGTASHPYAVHRRADGAVEQDAMEWWTAVTSTVRTVTAAIDPSRVRALGISAQGGALVCVDADLVPLGPAVSWLDSRAEDAAASLRARFGADGFYDRTGWNLGPRYNAAHILRIRETEPELFARTAFFLSTSDFILGRLTGDVALDVNSAAITQLMDTARRTYDQDILDAVGVTDAVLPRLVPSGTAVGTLTAAAADDLGLPRTVLAVAGGHDQYCAVIGSGAGDPSTLVLSTGTAWVTLGAATVIVADPGHHVSVSPHILPGTWGQFASLLNGGPSLEWLRALWADSTGPLSYDQVSDDVSATAPGAEGVVFLPHFGATVPDWNDASRGSFVGLDLTHERRHLVRATLEGIAFEAVDLIGRQKALNPGITRVRVIGGATRSPVWPRIIADVLGDTIELSTGPDAALLGAAVIAAAASPDRIAASAAHMVPTVRDLEPGPDSEVYAALAPRRAAMSRQVSRVYTATTKEGA